MKTLKEFVNEIHASNRIIQDATKKEVIECLDIIAQDVMSGKTTLLHANTLLAVRHGLMSPAEQKSDYDKNEKELTKMASALGKKGGSAKTPAKKKSSAENGKLGGRPKGSGKKKDEDK